MNIKHHPSEEQLLDYTSGALGEAWGLAIATHLALCPDCRRTVAFMEDVGGCLLETVSPVPVKQNAFETLLTELENVKEEVKTPPSEIKETASLDRPVLPQPLRSYLGCDVGELSWEGLGMGTRQVKIQTGEEGGATVRLLRIPAGRKVPHHSHGGREMTLVLSGGFSDETGSYGRGDLQEADTNVKHQPHASLGEDCVCLAVTDAPLRFSNFAPRFFQRWLNI
jgi:putative transcriptional regulator